MRWDGTCCAPNALAQQRTRPIRCERSEQSILRSSAAAYVRLPELFSISHRTLVPREPARFDPAPRPCGPEPAPLHLAHAHPAKRTWTRALNFPPPTLALGASLREEFQSKYRFRSPSLPNAQAQPRTRPIRCERSEQSMLRSSAAAYVRLPKLFSISHRAPVRREPARFDHAPRPLRARASSPAPGSCAPGPGAHGPALRPFLARPSRSALKLARSSSQNTRLGARRCLTP